MSEFRSQTVAVTVFPDRARVTRRGRATFTPGLHTIAFRDLPLALIPDSVRASGRGSAKAKMLGVNARREYFAETPSEAPRDLERQIESREDEDTALAARLAVVENEQSHLAALGSQAEMFARGLALRSRTVDEQMALFDALASRGHVLAQEKLALSSERRALARELDRLRRELSLLRGARPRERWIGEVEVECLAEGELDVELTYVVTNAGWKPLYDLRLSEAKLDVTYLAQVAQTTGEDWSSVALTMSTAFPALSLVAPELDPWYVVPYVPRPAMVKSAPAPVAMRAMTVLAPAETAQPAAAEMPAAAAVEAEVAQAEVSTAGAAVTYRVGGSSDVPGNGTPRKTTIAVFDLRPTLDYVCAPKLADAAYRRATIKNESALLLLPGPVQLFEGEEYLGATALELTSPGQEFELVLGVDDRVRVKRELKAREVDKRFVGDRRRLRYAYEIELENLRDADQTILVRDHIPVSRHEDIKVKLEQSDPKVTEQTELNLLEWKLSLGKGRKQTVRYEYSVEHPRAMEVRGLV